MMGFVQIPVYLHLIGYMSLNSQIHDPMEINE